MKPITLPVHCTVCGDPLEIDYVPTLQRMRTPARRTCTNASGATAVAPLSISRGISLPCDGVLMAGEPESDPAW
jgi:hypothetical protein